ncbi:hypothetical protein BDV3_007152 [Batrachochytrium dendrobatidis]
MTKQLKNWIRECAALSEYELNQQLKSINGQFVKSFLAAIEKSSTNQTKQVTVRELEKEILKLRIKEHLLALTDKSISNLKKLFYRRHIGQDLIDLRDTTQLDDLEEQECCVQNVVGIRRSE